MGHKQGSLGVGRCLSTHPPRGQEQEVCEKSRNSPTLPFAKRTRERMKGKTWGKYLEARAQGREGSMPIESQHERHRDRESVPPGSGILRTMWPE